MAVYLAGQAGFQHFSFTAERAKIAEDYLFCFFSAIRNLCGKFFALSLEFPCFQL
jgi:hypothetical protein